MNKRTLFGLLGVLVVVGFGAWAYQQQSSSSSDAVASVITEYCQKGTVHLWRDVETGQDLYELRESLPGHGFAGTYQFYGADGKTVGTAEWTDTPTLTLNDGTKSFCSYGGEQCPEYIGEFCQQ